MNKIPFVAIAATSALFLSACAGSGTAPMTAGERISQRGGTISEYGEAWTAGQKNVRQGERLIDKGSTNADRARKQLSDARKQVAQAEQRLRDAENSKTDGQRLVSDGTSQMQRAEADYAVIRSGPSATQPRPRN
ncbi:MAG: hypothetical protein ACK4MX_00525 [Thermaurantiacus sp.]